MFLLTITLASHALAGEVYQPETPHSWWSNAPFEDGKCHIVDFFFRACRPCLLLAPRFQEAAQRMEKKGCKNVHFYNAETGGPKTKYHQDVCFTQEYCTGAFPIVRMWGGGESAANATRTFEHSVDDCEPYYTHEVEKWAMQNCKDMGVDIGCEWKAEYAIPEPEVVKAMPKWCFEDKITNAVDAEDSVEGDGSDIYIGLGVAFTISFALAVLAFLFYLKKKKSPSSESSSEPTHPITSSTPMNHVQE
eukprot:GEMP01038881.1.p1 GENE.GEMP01038881.1~~GEMP01038881.1.p1  ORF type:complete len:248 (+),score=59.02 GEMP01038881.1:59-802(+)